MNLKNVWRVGANWGGQSVLDLFFDYGVAFFGTDSGRLGNYEAAKPGDLLAVSNPGEYKIVAIAEVLTPFMPLHKLGVLFPQSVLDEYGSCGNNESTVGCHAKFYILKEQERHNCSDYKRFYSMGKDERINALYDKHSNKEDKGEFDIEPRTAALFNSNGERAGLFALNVRYRIPIYQRPYSWGEAEISKLLEDIFMGASRNERKFIGTMQLSEPVPLDAEGRSLAYDVIDGQQRITTFLLLFRVLQLKWGLFDGIVLSGILRTLVNRGEAQRSLDRVWNLSLEELQTLDMANVYCRNMDFIFSDLNDRLTPDTEKPVDIKALEKYLKESILLVIIQTNAGLSKTLEIFNIINTTGLDLNGADIFKIRFYEFLTDKRGEGHEVFDKVSELYQDIEVRNRTDSVRSSMPEILEILQALIVGKYGLSLELMNYATDRFFSELFDSLLGIKQWKSFAENKVAAIVNDKDGPLSIAGIKKIIQLRYQYGLITEMPNGQIANERLPSLSSAFMHAMIFESRYSRYWFYPVIFMYRFGEYGKFSEVLLKLVLTYSLIYAKSIYRVHSVIQDICRKMFDNGATQESVLDVLKVMQLAERNECKNAICNYEIAWNRKWKMIACRLSEFLTYTPEERMETNRAAFDQLFRTAIDIEHIQSYHDKDGNMREQIWAQWGSILNGIGNLTMLESNINRSIGNEPFKEKVNPGRTPSYHNSMYRNVQEMAKKSIWSKEQCIARRDAETKKIMDFLYGETSTTLQTVHKSTSHREHL